MKKLLVAFLFISSFCNAQNYQCLQSGVKRYFTNGNGYLRGIRIDSVKTMGDTVVYYPFHTARGNYLPPGGESVTLDSTGGSWLGKRVLQLGDSTFLFDNEWGNIVTIKPQANPGDIWEFYADTSTKFYMASLTSVDTMTVLGSFDSIKTVRINAYNSSGIDTTDPVNGFKIVLSKNHGFVQVFDLYTFPYHLPGSAYTTGLDYFLDRICGNYAFAGFGSPTTENSIFSIVSLINPTYEQLYDWHTGDVFENRIFESGVTSDGVYPYGYYFDSITNRTVFADSIMYSYSGWLATENLPMGTINPDIQYPFDMMSINSTFIISNSLLIDTTMMPEEVDQPWLQFYYPGDSSYCIYSDRYEMIQSQVVGNTFYDLYFEGDPIQRIYKTGIGLLNYDWNVLFGSPPEVQDTTLIYYVKGGSACGSYVTPSPIYTLVPELSSVYTISIFPNPATTQLTIQSTDGQINQLTISNLLGQTVYNQQHGSTSLTMTNANTQLWQIDVSGLPPGVYFVKVNNTVVRKFVKE